MAHAMKRRGLSDVVTTVLIILLVLAAVAIIWGYLRGALEQSGSQITGACLTLDLKPLSCNVSANGLSATVRYGRNSGEATLSNVTLVFADSTGATKSNFSAPTPNALETKVYTVDGFTATTKPVSVSVAGTVITESGDSKQCDRTAVVQCTP